MTQIVVTPGDVKHAAEVLEAACRGTEPSLAGTAAPDLLEAARAQLLVSQAVSLLPRNREHQAHWKGRIGALDWLLRRLGDPYSSVVRELAERLRGRCAAPRRRPSGQDLPEGPPPESAGLVTVYGPLRHHVEILPEGVRVIGKAVGVFLHKEDAERVAKGWSNMPELSDDQVVKAQWVTLDGGKTGWPTHEKPAVQIHWSGDPASAPSLSPVCMITCMVEGFDACDLPGSSPGDRGDAFFIRREDAPEGAGAGSEVLQAALVTLDGGRTGWVIGAVPRVGFPIQQEAETFLRDREAGKFEDAWKALLRQKGISVDEMGSAPAPDTDLAEQEVKRRLANFLPDRFPDEPRKHRAKALASTVGASSGSPTLELYRVRESPHGTMRAILLQGGVTSFATYEGDGHVPNPRDLEYVALQLPRDVTTPAEALVLKAAVAVENVGYRTLPFRFYDAVVARRVTDLASARAVVVEVLGAERARELPAALRAALGVDAGAAALGECPTS